MIGPQTFSTNSFEEIIIPEGVERIEQLAFANNNSIKKVVIPSTVEELGGALFQNCKSDITVYYNAINTKLKSDTGATPFQTFYEGDLIICPDEESFWKCKANKEVFGPYFYSGGQYQLTYEMDIEYFDKDGNKLNVNYPLKKLFYQDSLWEKINNEWKRDLITEKTTQIPPLPDETSLGYKANYWAISEMGFATIDKSGKVSLSTDSNGGDLGMARFFTSNKLYAVEDIFKIEIKAANKVYDGKNGMEVSFNRNIQDYLKVNGEGGKHDIDCFVYFKDKNMSWDDSLKWQYMRSNKLQFDVKNVADSGEYAVQFIYYDYRFAGDTVFWATPSANYSDSDAPIETTISITPATSKYNPTNHKLAWKNQTELPIIKPGKNDTPGTIKWEAGQTPKKGINKYKYIFTPEGSTGTKFADKTANPLTMDNYVNTEIKGEIEINYYNAYTVNFTDKDGNIISTKEVEEGKNVVAPTPPKVDGYTFVRWSESLENIRNDVDIKPIYKKDIVNFTVTFKDKDGKVITTKEVQEGTDVTAPVPPKVNGYTFVGWNKSLANVISDMEITAIYKKDEVKIANYTVIFKDKNGKVITTKEVQKGADVFAPVPPKVNGYTFVGWSKSLENVVGNMEVYALYKKNVVNSNPVIKPVTKPETDPIVKEEKISSLINNIEKIQIRTKNGDKIFNKNITVHIETASKVEKDDAEKAFENARKVFNVVLKEDGVKIDKEFDTKLLVTIDIEEYKDYEDIKIYQMTKDGKYIELNTEIVKDEITFECESLDTYVLTAIEKESDTSLCNICGLCTPLLGICLFIWGIAIIIIGTISYYVYNKRKKMS